MCLLNTTNDDIALTLANVTEALQGLRYVRSSIQNPPGGGDIIMMNMKQQELVDRLFQTVNTRFPEVELLNVSPSAEDPRDLWVNVTAPADKDRECALMELASASSADILMDYGYSILVLPEHRQAA